MHCGFAWGWLAISCGCLSFGARCEYLLDLVPHPTNMGLSECWSNISRYWSDIAIPDLYCSLKLQYIKSIHDLNACHMTFLPCAGSFNFHHLVWVLHLTVKISKLLYVIKIFLYPFLPDTLPKCRRTETTPGRSGPSDGAGDWRDTPALPGQTSTHSWCHWGQKATSTKLLNQLRKFLMIPQQRWHCHLPIKVPVPVPATLSHVLI